MCSDKCSDEYACINCECISSSSNQFDNHIGVPHSCTNCELPLQTTSDVHDHIGNHHRKSTLSQVKDKVNNNINTFLFRSSWFSQSLPPTSMPTPSSLRTGNLTGVESYLSNDTKINEVIGLIKSFQKVI